MVLSVNSFRVAIFDDAYFIGIIEWHLIFIMSKISNVNVENLRLNENKSFATLITFIKIRPEIRNIRLTPVYMKVLWLHWESALYGQLSQCPAPVDWEKWKIPCVLTWPRIRWLLTRRSLLSRFKISVPRISWRKNDCVYSTRFIVSSHKEISCGPHSLIGRPSSDKQGRKQFTFINWKQACILCSVFRSSLLSLDFNFDFLYLSNILKSLLFGTLFPFSRTDWIRNWSSIEGINCFRLLRKTRSHEFETLPCSRWAVWSRFWVHRSPTARFV